ncbi:DNA polymerase III subunit alpha [Pelotomaculum sp. FP]|uniref:DNA polymerase III subunit alpha n=1 Tax=Pelotomaculum sp. FP TaxID=261474 RepID=UPI0011021DD6|nr:DNA polymerase III subunit alpha [Pelotomaculum sp. FP]TEB15626.1 DNA polymerase III subunit alpha [Pelotomaculum sp. FP]
MKVSVAGFVHLHVHTEYSLLQATCRLEELIQKAKSFGMNSLAITDKGGIDGAIRFYELARKYGLHPVIGCEMKVNDAGESLILLAATNRGYAQIVKWLNSGFSQSPAFPGDVIALSGGRNGSIYRLLARGEMDLAEEQAREYANCFGEGNFYLEAQDHGLADERMIMERTVRLSQKTGISLVATHDVHYLVSEDASLLQMLQNIPQTQQAAARAFYFPSSQEMEEKFRDLPSALANTDIIAWRCQVRLDPGCYRLPQFPVPEGWNEEAYLKHLCLEGLHRRFALQALSDGERQKVMERMNRELALIFARGLASYFLIVWDMVKFARQSKIPVGPGRGSAAGSLVVYLLGVTEVNPLVHELSFERFLSPDRADLPDIDLDVCQVRRPEILQYIKDKYGAGRVVHIGVLNTYGTRGAIREAGKYLKLPEEHIDLLAKLLPPFTGQGGIRHCLEKLPELRQLPVRQEPYKSLFHYAQRMEGLPRNHSAHPSGILIGHEELAAVIPLQHRPNGALMTSFNKEDIQALGLLKIDLLGLRNLSVIYGAFQAIRNLTGKEIEIKDIPLDDPDTFRTMEKGDTLGCFQLESMGIRSLMRRLRPQNLEDLTALLALYRPGAWQEGIVETYLRRRHGQEKSDFLLPELEEILSRTYGLILYQEQVMQIAHVLAGYSMGEADSLRRALAQKSVAGLARHRRRFVRGAMARGRSQEEADAVFDFLARFAGYSFNKAHSVSYAYISYWTVYLKTHYPKEYMAALLSSEGGYYDKRVYFRETVKMGIPLFSPDVNGSSFGFQVEKEGIRIGMDAIKGSGPEAVASLLCSRQKDGHFTSFQELAKRMKAYGVKRPVLQGWIAAGACDSLGDNRRLMIFSLNSLKNSLYAGESLDTSEDFSASEKRRMEKLLLGFSLVQTPSNKWRQFLKRYQIAPIDTLCEGQKNKRVRICGAIIHSRRQPTGNGEYVLFLVLQDHSGMVEVSLYPKTYKACLYELNPQGIIVEGILYSEDKNLHIVAEKIKALGG